jgi:hypothetical protein
VALKFYDLLGNASRTELEIQLNDGTLPHTGTLSGVAADLEIAKINGLISF